MQGQNQAEAQPPHWAARVSQSSECHGSGTARWPDHEEMQPLLICQATHVSVIKQGVHAEQLLSLGILLRTAAMHRASCP